MALPDVKKPVSLCASGKPLCSGVAQPRLWDFALPLSGFMILRNINKIPETLAYSSVKWCNTSTPSLTKGPKCQHLAYGDPQKDSENSKEVTQWGAFIFIV